MPHNIFHAEGRIVHLKFMAPGDNYYLLFVQDQ
jgi:hypothetical protein